MNNRPKYSDKDQKCPKCGSDKVSPFHQEQYELINKDTDKQDWILVDEWLLCECEQCRFTLGERACLDAKDFSDD